MNGTGGVHRAQALSGRGGFVHCASFHISASPLYLLLCVPLSAPRNLMGFRYIVRRHNGTYVNSQYTGTPGSSLSQYSSNSSTLVLTVYTGRGDQVELEP